MSWRPGPRAGGPQVSRKGMVTAPLALVGSPVGPWLAASNSTRVRPEDNALELPSAADALTTRWAIRG